jgi:2'-5' RNA ligase
MSASSSRAHHANQLWLPGLEAPPVATDGLFFAALPDANTAGSIAKFAQQICGETRSKSKPHAANRLHVTLQHLGNFAGGLPQERVDAAIKAAASIRMEPFSVAFDHVLSFAPKPRPGPLVLGGSEGVVGLHTLHEALVRALQQAGFGDDPAVLSNATQYTPHVTLAYGMPWIAARPVDAASWNVREFVLMHSLLGRTRHVELGRWPLAA